MRSERLCQGEKAYTPHTNENYLNNQSFGSYKPTKWFYMLTQKQLRIFEVFAKHPFAEQTRKVIKKQSKEKSNNALALAINQFKKERVVLERKIGKSGILSLNLDNDLTIHYLALCNTIKIPNIVKHAVDGLKQEISEETPFCSIGLFGSYAEGNQKKGSDLDIAIFIEHAQTRKKIEALVNSAKLKGVTEMDVHVIPKAEMLEMLANKEENLGKQIARKHLAVHNHRIFYDIIKEGMDHGFRI